MKVFRKTREKIQLTENEIDKLYNNGKITLGEAEFLRKGGGHRR